MASQTDLVYVANRLVRAWTEFDEVSYRSVVAAGKILGKTWEDQQST